MGNPFFNVERTTKVRAKAILALGEALTPRKLSHYRINCAKYAIGVKLHNDQIVPANHLSSQNIELIIDNQPMHDGR